MAETKTRIPLAQAGRLAAEVVALLEPACERIEIAGTIRRGKPDVGDLEILAMPIIEQGHDMFGEPNCAYINRLDTICTLLLRDHTFEPRRDVNGRGAFGERYKRLSYKGVALDLFSVIEPAQWGVLYLIRTGPADFSHRFVTSRTAGGMLPPWAQVADGAIRHRGTGEVYATPEEADVFALIGVEWIEPGDRQ